MAQYEILDVDRGVDWDVTITVYDRDGNPVDLTGSAGAMQIRKTPMQPNPPLMSLAAERFSFNAAGEIRIQVPAADTSVNWRRGYFDLEVTKAGKVTREVEGEIRVHWDVTR